MNAYPRLRYRLLVALLVAAFLYSTLGRLVFAADVVVGVAYQPIVAPKCLPMFTARHEYMCGRIFASGFDNRR